MPASFTDPAVTAVAVTPSDTVAITPNPTRALYVGGGGNLAVLIGANTVTFSGVQAGSILPICVTRVNATNTTATNIVALY